MSKRKVIAGDFRQKAMCNMQIIQWVKTQMLMWTKPYPQL